jgi:hypothetical protein
MHRFNQIVAQYKPPLSPSEQRELANNPHIKTAFAMRGPILATFSSDLQSVRVLTAPDCTYMQIKNRLEKLYDEPQTGEFQRPSPNTLSKMNGLEIIGEMKGPYSPVDSVELFELN